jgi:hypothetical protein
VINVNRYKVQSPVRSFSGESVGVQFTHGTGFVDDSTKDGRAAIEYFRRQGYALLPVEDDEEVSVASGPVSTEDALTNLGHGSAPSVGLGIGVPEDPEIPQSGPRARVAEQEEGGEQFDPAQHSADEVNAHLDTTTDEAEINRVLEAERHGKARKTILARGEQKRENEQ